MTKKMKKEKAKKRKYKNGELILGHGYCERCQRSQGSSMILGRMKYLDGHLYCLDCYPQMVDVYLADKRLKNG